MKPIVMAGMLMLLADQETAIRGQFPNVKSFSCSFTTHQLCIVDTGLVRVAPDGVTHLLVDEVWKPMGKVAPRASASLISNGKSSFLFSGQQSPIDIMEDLQENNGEGWSEVSFLPPDPFRNVKVEVVNPSKPFPYPVYHSPVPRFRAQIAACPVDGSVLVFGGKNGYYNLSEMHRTWIWAEGVWTEVETPLDLQSRHSGGLAYFPPLKGFLLIGGQLTKGGDFATDVWLFADRRWTKMEPLSGGPSVFDFSCAYFPPRESLLLVGVGNEFANETREMWEVSLEGKWRRLNLPRQFAPRSGGSTWYDNRDGRFHFAGGVMACDECGFFVKEINEHWAYDGESWKQCDNLW